MTKVTILVPYFKIKITEHVLRGVNYSLLKNPVQEKNLYSYLKKKKKKKSNFLIYKKDIKPLATKCPNIPFIWVVYLIFKVKCKTALLNYEMCNLNITSGECYI